MSARVAWETPVWSVARAAPKKTCSVLSLRANTRSEGHGQQFSASGFAVTDSSAENIEAQGRAAFHLTTLMVEWPESGSNFGGGSKNQPYLFAPKAKALVTLIS